MTEPISLPTPICSRALATDDGRQVFAEIGMPERADGGAWRCAFFVRGIHQEPKYAFGIDGFQALTLAIMGLRATLEASDVVFTQEGAEPGNHGVPPIVPTEYGREFCERVERFIEGEMWALFALKE